MTEYGIPLSEILPNGTLEVLEQIAPHGVEIVENTLPRVDAARGVFITSRGDEIELSDKPVSALVVERIQAEGKPKIPMIEVSILGRKQSEPHVGHEGYQARLKEWESESQIALMRYLFVVGTKGQPPQ